MISIDVDMFVVDPCYRFGIVKNITKHLIAASYKLLLIGSRG